MPNSLYDTIYNQVAGDPRCSGMSLSDASEEIHKRITAILAMPWEMGCRERGHGNTDYSVMAGEYLIVECCYGKIAAVIVNDHNELLNERMVDDD